MYYTGLAPKYEIGGYVTIGRSVLCTHKSYVDRLEVIYVHIEKIPQSGDMSDPFLYLSKFLYRVGQIC